MTAPIRNENTALRIHLHAADDAVLPKSPRAVEMLNLLHDRHVPITPDLASALVLLEGEGAAIDLPIWGLAFERASESVGLFGRAGRSRVWAQLLAEFTQIIVEPVLRSAAADLAELRLLSPGNFPPQAGALADSRWPDYPSYCAALEGVVRLKLGACSAMGMRFWHGAAVQLHAVATSLAQRQRYARADYAAPLPLPFEPDHALIRSVFEIEPEFARKSELKRSFPKPNIRSNLERMGMRPKEGGISGILHSHRLEDLPDTLVSELAYPNELFLLRLLDEGYLIRNRPPLRKPARDLLVLALCEPAPPSRPATVLNAAWADASLRLRVLLNQTGLPASDLGFCDFHTAGPRAGAVSSALPPAAAYLSAFDIHGAQRLAQHMQSTMTPALFSLLPGQLDTTPKEEMLPPLQQGSAAILKAVSAARRDRIAADWPRLKGKFGGLPNTDQFRPAAMSDYTRAMSLHFAPDARTDEAGFDWSRFRSETARSLGLSRLARTHVAALHYPKDLKEGAVFYGYSGMNDRPTEFRLPPADVHNGIGQLVGALSAWIILRVMEVAHAG